MIHITGGRLSGAHKNPPYQIDDIVEYDPEEDTIIPVGHMIETRAFHAVSVVQAADYLQWCIDQL